MEFIQIYSRSKETESQSEFIPKRFYINEKCSMVNYNNENLSTTNVLVFNKKEAVFNFDTANSKRFFVKYLTGLLYLYSEESSMDNNKQTTVITFVDKYRFVAFKINTSFKTPLKLKLHSNQLKKPNTPKLTRKYSITESSYLHLHEDNNQVLSIEIIDDSTESDHINSKENIVKTISCGSYETLYYTETGNVLTLTSQSNRHCKWNRLPIAKVV